MTRILLICLGGFLGTGARYGLNGWISHRFGETFPLGTLTINISGSFVIGIVFIATGPDSRVLVSADVRQFLMIGILGGYTTFSSFSLQTLTLLRDGEVGAAIANVGLSVAVGLVAAWAGESVAKGVWLPR